MKKYRVTHAGIYEPRKEGQTAEQRIPVGTVIEVGKGESLPAKFKNKVVEVGSVDDLEVTQPEPAAPAPSGEERQKLLKAVAISLPDDQFTEAGLPKVAAVNGEVEKDQKFDGEEIAKLYPGIADAVAAERQSKVG